MDLRTLEPGFVSSERVQSAGRLADRAAAAIQNANLCGRVRQANDAKSQLASVVAHELRTPMTPIRGYTEMLLRELPGPLT
jgi:signal transduction histidine kinase